MSDSTLTQVEEDKKPNGMVTHINVHVNVQDGAKLTLKIKRNTPLKKLMTECSDQRSVELNTIRFLFDGVQLRAEQTPDDLEMQDGDEIDLMLEQLGGGSDGYQIDVNLRCSAGSCEKTSM